MTDPEHSDATLAEKAWYLLYTKPRQEHVARENLERQLYEVYLPLIRNRRRRAGRYIEQVEAMFPRYLFIRLDQGNDNWSPIRSTYGVSNLVYFGFKPARVAPQMVEFLRTRDDESGCQSLPPPEFAQGDRVRIVEGAMAGYEGIFHARTARDRVTILLAFAGSFTQVDLSLHQLEPAT